MNKKELFDKIDEIFPKIVEHRRHLHKHPELSFREYSTTEYLKNALNQLGIPFSTPIETGLVGLIGDSENCVALRADIDALPVFEETGLDFASVNNGIMHACGHDFHTAILLGAAEILNTMKDELQGSVKLIFQPGEEKLPGGASILINHGVLENPVPKAVFGQHIYPSENVGVLAIESGPVLASADEIYWTIRGRGSHAAQPHLGNDPIITAAQLVLFYQSAIVKFRNPLNPGVLSVATIQGGSATNIFPEEVKMMGTLRSYNNDWRFEMHDIIMNKSQLIADLYGCKCDIDIVKGYPPVVNDNNMTKFIRKTALDILGIDNVTVLEPKMYAEDFAYYAEKVPSAFWMIGVKPANLNEMPPLHNSKLSPDENVIKNGIAIMVKAAVDFLNSGK